MNELTTDEARIRLDVSPQHVRALLRSGQLEGRQLSSGAWLVDEDSLERRIALNVSRGRSWSAISSWALLAELSGEPGLVSIPERTRARVRERIRRFDSAEIARRVAGRTTVTRYDADSRDSVAGPDLIPTGLFALEVLNTDLAIGDRTVEGYVSAAAMSVFIQSHLLVPDRDGTIEIYEDPGIMTGRLHAPSAVVAADLARRSTTRVRSAGITALEDLRQKWLAKNTR